MAYIAGEGRNQGTLFPITLEELIPADHVCRVIDAFVDTLAMSQLGFERAKAADTGRPGYDPRDLLKVYLYGYLNQIRSSRRLEAECRRNVELMWLLGRLYPDHKANPTAPTVMYRQERISTETGRLLALMATPPAPRHSVPMLRGPAAEPHRPPEAREPFRQNLLCPDASHFQTRTKPMTAQSPHTLGI